MSSTAFQLEERIEKCRRILDDNPRSQIFAALGEAYRKKGDLERAYLITKQGLEIHPEYGPAHVVMAKIYIEKRLYQEAEKELEQAVRLDGKTRATEKLLAEVWLKKGELDRAQETLLRLRENGPPDEGISTLLNLAKNLKERPLVNPPQRVVQPAPLLNLTNRFAALEESQFDRPAPVSDEDYHSWASVLDALKSFPLVQGALVIGLDGLVVENRTSGQTNPDLIGPLCLSIVETVSQNLPRIDFGKLGQLLIETATVKIWIWSLKAHYLMLWTNPDVNLGCLKMRISHISEQIAF